MNNSELYSIPDSFLSVFSTENQNCSAPNVPQGNSINNPVLIDDNTPQEVQRTKENDVLININKSSQAPTPNDNQQIWLGIKRNKDFPRKKRISQNQKKCLSAKDDSDLDSIPDDFLSIFSTENKNCSAPDISQGNSKNNPVFVDDELSRRESSAHKRKLSMTEYKLPQVPTPNANQKISLGIKRNKDFPRKKRISQNQKNCLSDKNDSGLYSIPDDLLSIFSTENQNCSESNKPDESSTDSAALVDGENDECNVSGEILPTEENAALSNIEEGVQYTCNICSKSFVDQFRLACHKKMHRSKIFLCSICGKQYKGKKRLDRHIADHQYAEN